MSGNPVITRLPAVMFAFHLVSPKILPMLLVAGESVGAIRVKLLPKLEYVALWTAVTLSNVSTLLMLAAVERNCEALP